MYSLVALIAGGSSIDGPAPGPGTMTHNLCDNKQTMKSKLCILMFLLLCFQSHAHIGNLWRLGFCDELLKADFLHQGSCKSVDLHCHIPADLDFASYVSPIPI